MILTIAKQLAVVSGLLGGGVLICRQYIHGKDATVDPNVKATGKVAIVTGSSSGIGKETAKELAKRGATVYMACRSAERCNTARDEIIKETKNDKVYCRKCDLEDFASIAEFAKSFKAEQKRLDILINNAAIFQGPIKGTGNRLSKSGIETQLAVNHVGHSLLTRMLLGLLKKSSPSRIVVVSCFSHEAGAINFEDINFENSYHPDHAYDQSKLANVLFSNKLAQILKGTGVTVNSVNPGLTSTDTGREYNYIDQSPPSQRVIRPVLDFIAKTPRQGAQTSIFVALDPTLEKVTGKYFNNCAEQPPSPNAQDEVTADALWAMTEHLIQENSHQAS